MRTFHLAGDRRRRAGGATLAAAALLLLTAAAATFKLSVVASAPNAAGPHTSARLQSGGATAASSAWAASRAADPAAVAGYQPDLPRRMLQRGVVSYGESARARRALAKLLRGEAISIALLGGSSTWGQGADRVETNGAWRFPGSYANRVLGWVNQTFPRRPPQRPHTLVNAGVFAADSSYFALCHRLHVPEDADLIFVELNINDGARKECPPADGDASRRDAAEGDAARKGSGPAGVWVGQPERRAHERLLRRLLSLPNRPAVVELVQWIHPWLPLDHRAPVPWRWAGDDEIGTMAVYYRLPWLSTRSLTWGNNGIPEIIELPLPDISMQNKPQNLTGAGSLGRLWGDRLGHPSAQGHAWVAQMVVHWMQQALEDVARRPLEAEDEELAQEELPPPLYPGNREASASVCNVGPSADLEGMVAARHDAFQLVNEGSEHKPKWGWVSTTPGSTLELKLNTALLRGTAAAGSNVTVGIGHLKSYERMGIFLLECVAGCACDPLLVDGSLNDRGSQLHLAQLAATQAEDCRVRVTLQANTTSGETKVKILGTVVSEAQERLRAFALPMDIAARHPQNV